MGSRKVAFAVCCVTVRAQFGPKFHPSKGAGMKRLVILLSVLLIAVTGPAFAQSTTGTIEVIVTDSSGAPLPGVTVTASASDTNTRRTEVTGADGTASLVSLQPSNKYVVETSLEGFGKSQN